VNGYSIYQWIGLIYISWENLWIPVDFPLNQSIESKGWHQGVIDSVIPLAEKVFVDDR
jgi:hypothetical protein